MAKTTNVVDSSIYHAALEGLELQRQRIEEQIKQVRGLISGNAKPRKQAAAPATVAAAAEPAPAKRRKLSAQARKRIAEAQKKRWAAFRKTQGEES